jgi:hypothetical protein
MQDRQRENEDETEGERERGRERKGKRETMSARFLSMCRRHIGRSTDGQMYTHVACMGMYFLSHD